MKTNIILALDNRRPKADGTHAILLRIVHHRIPSQVTTGIYIKPKDWDEKKRIVLPSYKGTETVARLNNLLQKKKTEAMDIILKLDEKKKLDALTVLQIKELIEKKTDRSSFFSYTERLISEMEEANRIGNARLYKFTLSVLKTFRGQKDLLFEDINLAFLTKFETAHLKKGKSYNGLSVYLRTIRAIFNSAIKAGLVDRESYPFVNYEIKSTKTRKRAISLEAIQRIEKLVLLDTHPLYHARNYFLVSFYLRGMSFADLAQLKVGDIIDGRVNYQRRKTDKPYSVKIIDEVRQILNIYIKDKPKEAYIFPIIDRITPQEQYKDIEWARKRFNNKLKDIAGLCNIDEILTSYVSRHSFATRAKNLGIPIANISDMLGHGDIKTTEIYLDSLPTALLDEDHEKVVR
jgi:integrase/recombinase XerD